MTEETKLILEELKKVKEDIKDIRSTFEEDIKDIRLTLEEDIKDIRSTLGKDIKDIRLTLENETNKNIKIIAEAHLDLNRKLDEALKVENEKEMLLIRVNILENELRKIKEHLSA